MRLLPQLKACQNKAVKPCNILCETFREKVQIAIRYKAGDHASLEKSASRSSSSINSSPLCLALLSSSRAEGNLLGGVEESLRIVQTFIASPVSAPLSSSWHQLHFCRCPAGSFVTSIKPRCLV
jgi:hypothetical protein